MPDFILLMHDDATGPESSEAWDEYITGLNRQGAFQGGSAIGAGRAVRRDGPPAPLSPGLSGFIRVSAPDLTAAEALVAGNPVYEAGGTVEVRELPTTP
jgi:hypothetical protein